MRRCAFWETRETVDLSRGGRDSRIDHRLDTGVAVTHYDPSFGAKSQWRELKADLADVVELSPSGRRLLAEASQAVPLGKALIGAAGELLDVLSAAKDSSSRFELHLRSHRQRVVIEQDDLQVADTRSHLLLEIRAIAQAGGETAALQREHAFSDVADLLAASDTLRRSLEPLREMAAQRLEAAAPETGPTVVVIPPGADAGVFFHELAGHPLEGDVVARRASYLARRIGEQVAQDFVSVIDHPVSGTGTLGFCIDDEGNPALPASLVNAGRVQDSMTDVVSSRSLGSALNGHARRVSFRHPAIPRMSHTQLAPHEGDLASILGSVGRGLLVRSLTPRHVSLLTGDFSFFVDEAQLIRDGQLGPFIAPAILRGNGLRALAGIVAVGADLQPFFGRKGCGKLDHGPLPVSFGNPTVKINSMEIAPWT